MSCGLTLDSGARLINKLQEIFMSFSPDVGDSIQISNTRYCFTEHPSAKGMPYGQTGRRATVYQVQAVAGDLHALKVFSQAFRSPRVAEGTIHLKPFARLPGLRVCDRSVVTPDHGVEFLKEYPDLLYSVLMPWVIGETWQEVIQGGQPFTKDQSQKVAASLAHVLVTMEEEGIAHCDLSGPNILLPRIGEGEQIDEMIALVDVEDLYAPGLTKPEKPPAGSAGYAHKSAPKGLWNADADRFAGAILLAEMLGWCDERIRHIAFGEQYFDPGEMQQNCERYRVMQDILQEQWGESVADALNQAWYSENLGDCPSQKEWAILLGVKKDENHHALEVSSLDEKSPDHQENEIPVQGPTVLDSTQIETAEQIGGFDHPVGDLEVTNQSNTLQSAEDYANAILRRGEKGEENGNIQPAVVSPPSPQQPNIRKKRNPIVKWFVIVPLVLVPIIVIFVGMVIMPYFAQGSGTSNAPVYVQPTSGYAQPTSEYVQPTSGGVEIFANQGWQSTGLNVKSGQVITITYVSGVWSAFTGDNGYPWDPGSSGGYQPNANWHGMIARIGGADQPVFTVNSPSYQLIAPASAFLYLRINDIDVGDNSGSIMVSIKARNP